MISRWEIYEEGETKPFSDRVHVSINRKGVMFVNGTAFELLGRPEAVVLLFDRKEKVIGLNPAPASVKGTFRLKDHSKGRHRIINAAPFCRKFGIRIDGTSAFVQPWLDDHGILLLDLKSTVPARARRTRKLTGKEWAA